MLLEVFRTFMSMHRQKDSVLLLCQGYRFSFPQTEQSSQTFVLFWLLPHPGNPARPEFALFLINTGY
jgi:hypothetical protein